MDYPPTYTLAGVWGLFDVSKLHTPSILQAQRGLRAQHDPFSFLVTEYLLLGTVLCLFITEGVYLSVYSKSSCSFRLCWNLVTASSLAIQVIVIAWIGSHSALLIKDGTLSENPVFLAVCLATCLASLLNALSICLCLKSSRRGVYHLAGTFLWSRLSLGMTDPDASWTEACQFAFGIAFLLDVFSPEDLTPAQQSGVNPSSLFGALSYSWINPILASQKTLSIEDLPHIDLQPNFEQYQCSLLLTFERHKSFRHIFWQFLFLHHRSDLVKASFLRLIDDASKFTLPWILHSLLEQPSIQLVSVLFCLRVLGVLSGNYSLFYLRRVSIHYKAALCAAIHSKALRTRNAPSDLDVSTLSEVDTERLYQNLLVVLDIWSYPMQAILCLAGLSYLLPWQSTLSVVIASAAMGPLVNWTSGQLRHWTQKNMAAKDDRTKFTAEVLRAIQSIKAHGWESAFLLKLDEKREADVRAAAKLAVAYAVLVCLVQAIPCILTLAAFGVAFLIGHPLEGSVIFACVLLFTSLSSVLSAGSTLVLNFQASKACIMRIHSYLTTEEDPISTSTKEKASITKSARDIDIRNIHVAWPGRSPLLTKGQLSLRRNALTVITGPTGSGKSTLLNLLAHLLSPDDALGHGPDRVAFTSQAPFLTRGTIRDNILFGKRYDGAFYAKVIDACGLKPDLRSCPSGDQTMMNGAATISGGQKARICLARAVYARCDINIFDDPLAAIDVKLSKIIMTNLFGPGGLLANSITLMSSNSPHIMSVAHSVLSLERGTLTAIETKAPRRAELTPTRRQQLTTLHNLPGPSSSSRKEPRIIVEEIEPEPAANPAMTPTGQDSGHTEEPPAPSRQPIWRYIAYATLRNWSVAIFALISGRTVSFVATYCLKSMADTGSLADMPKLLLWFAGLSTAQVVLYMVFILLAYHLCIIPTAKRLHKALVASTLAHEMHYFERTPLGDILNYFTNDLARVDLSLSGSVLTLLAQYGNIILVGVLLTVSAPQSVALIIPAIFIFWVLQRTYLTKLRELRSCDVTSRASILGFLQDSDAGRTIFSVFGMTEDRIQNQKYLLEENARAQFPLSSINSWLAVRLEILCVTMQVMAVTALLHTSISLGTVGLVMTYVFQITNFLNVITRTTALFEADFLSFSRLQGQIDGIQDGNLSKELEDTHSMEPPSGSEVTRQPATANDPWLCSGKVEISQFSARYRPGLPLSLVSIDLAIAPGEKVAVIGRTGAGKSSLILALLGIIKGTSGRITIDGRDIALMDPITLRRSLALIPQTPVVFSCSVRDNLDPLGVYSDEQLLESLRESTADKALANIREAAQNDASVSLLDLEVDSRSSLSTGQVQFLSLARVILHGSKLLILDEATSSLQLESEARFQEVIWKRCVNTTVISVMHRLESTLQYDKVLVLDKGSVAAFGSPKELVLGQNEYYCSMLKEGGLEEQARFKFGAQRSA